MSDLKSLNEANAEAWRRHEDQVNAMRPHPNGIACPECGEELWDSNPSIALTSNPPQKNIHCPKCLYVGYRSA